MTTTDERSDSDLLLAFGRDGDLAAFEAFAGRHVDMIFPVSLRRPGHRQLAEETTRNVPVSPFFRSHVGFSAHPAHVCLS